MNKKTVVKYFGSQGATARFLGLSKQAVSLWPDLVPEVSARKLEKFTNYELSINEKKYKTSRPAECLTY